MKNGRDTNSCLYGEDLVAFIYDEMPFAERVTFENHLLKCDACTAELAEISISRLGVFEWHRDEFLPLATPGFAIPYEAREADARRVSWIDALRNVLASPLRLGFAGGSLAAIALAFVFISDLTTVSEVADGQIESVPTVSIQELIQPENGPSDPVAIEVENENAPLRRDFRPVRPTNNARTVRVGTSTRQKKTASVSTTAQNAPRLGNFVEPEDTSLRLADLVADIDTRGF